MLLASFVFVQYSFADGAGTVAKEETGAQHQAPQANFDEALAAMSGADSDAAVIKAANEALARCKAYDDFERFVSGVNKIIGERPGFKYIEALYYTAAKTRINEISFLSQQNDIESGRRYMAVNENYRKEAMDCLDKALAIAKSKDLMLEVYILKFMVVKDEFQPQRADDSLEEIAQRISKYSDDNALNMRQLSRVADELANNSLSNYALKLKTMYVGKVDPKAAQEVLEDIRRDADKNFARGNTKEASAIYDAYLTAGQPYLNKEALGAKTMEIAEKYFGANRYREARKYYETFAQGFPDSKVIDYCKYKTALCYYYEKDYTNAVAALDDFLKTYQNSVWFDRAFETLCRLYFCELPKNDAVAGLQKMIDNYYRKNIGDFAYVLLGLLYYNDKEYNKALDVFKKVDVNSVYSYTVDTISADIKDIKKGGKPSYGFGSKDKYRFWEPGKPITLEIVPMEAGDAGAWLKGSGKGEDKKLEVTYTDSGTPQVTVKPDAKIKFTLSTLSDEDKYAEYQQDGEDMSRLPRKVNEENEKDLIFLQWTSGGGKFVDERQTRDKVWQAPDEPGAYKISVTADDLGLVRLPDKGIRKDPNKEVTFIINIVNTPGQGQ